MINKLTAPSGTVAFVPWPDVTAWAACGWAIVETRLGGAVMRKK
jgi:hypothetical protein